VPFEFGQILRLSSEVSYYSEDIIIVVLPIVPDTFNNYIYININTYEKEYIDAYLYTSTIEKIESITNINVDVDETDEIYSAINSMVYSLSTSVNSMYSKVSVAGDKVVNSAKIYIYHPSPEVVDTRDSRYLSKIEESDKVIQESVVKKEALDSALSYLTSVDSKNKKIGSIVKMLIMMIMGDEN
jgi:hypothetical protein